MNTYWPRLWAENESLLREARRIEYLVQVTKDGQLACKACGRYLSWEPHEAHFQQHMVELDQFLARKQEGKREQTAEGFYPEPCTSCGNPIPRSGRPGRPPTQCDTCKFPFAASQPSEEAILAELGL